MPILIITEKPLAVRDISAVLNGHLSDGRSTLTKCFNSKRDNERGE